MRQAHTNSWYASTANWEADFPALEGEQHCDVCIIGGGYTGLSSALHLRKQGIEATVLEANRVCWGASGRNGGHVGTGQRADQHTLEKMLGGDDALALWQLGLDAVDLVVDLIHEHRIDCELKSGNLHVAASLKAAKELQEEVSQLRDVYACTSLRYVDREELASMSSAQGMHGGIVDEACRHLHPLNYGLGLARAARELGACIHENSRVLGYEEGSRIRVRTDRGVVSCEKLILACNGYLGKLEPRLAGQIMPINNYVLATEPLPEDTARRLIRDDTSMSDSRFVINYWKLSADNRLLFGGGESYTSRFPRDIAGFVRPYMLKIYPELANTTIEYGWGGTLAISLNRMPALGRLGQRILYAHGYSGHGVPTASLAGQLLAEAIIDKSERFELMARVPTPRFPGGTLLRWPGLVAGMLYYAMRDRFA